MGRLARASLVKCKALLMASKYGIPPGLTRRQHATLIFRIRRAGVATYADLPPAMQDYVTLRKSGQPFKRSSRIPLQYTGIEYSRLQRRIAYLGLCNYDQLPERHKDPTPIDRWRKKGGGD